MEKKRDLRDYNKEIREAGMENVKAEVDMETDKEEKQGGIEYDILDN